MNYQQLFAGEQSVRYALTGACGGFARTLLAQTRCIPRLHPAVLCDLDIPGTRALCLELGYEAVDLVECSTADDLASIPETSIALVSDISLIDTAHYDILVEATGNPAIGYRAASQAISSVRHVAMISKEVDAVAGVDLARQAAASGCVYTTADGDQPANLIGWISWARTLGLEIVAAGKSSEYDLVFDPDSATITQLDETITAPDMAHLLQLGDKPLETLRARRAALGNLNTSATADYCEMAVVATNTGLVPDTERLHYPIARCAELADVYALQEDEGMLSKSGVIDVFNVLRLPQEASFAGGVFIVVRTSDQPTWQLLKQKGHVVSRNERYACLYLPYHFMGVETPITLLEAVLNKRPSGATLPEQHVVLGGRTQYAMPAGTLLSMGGHHHDVSGVDAVLLERQEDMADIAPLYLAANTKLKRDVKAGEVLTLSALEHPDKALLTAWQRGLSPASVA